VANLVLAFAEIVVGAIVLDAGVKGDSIANVVQGKATQHPLATATGATATGGGTTTGGVAVAPGTYTNPVPGASTGRIDQGVDYTLSASGFRAPGRSQIIAADQHNSGWAGGGYIAAKLLDGPLAGSVYYVAEGVAPAAGIAAGKIVDAGTQLVTRATNPYNGSLGNIEAGWANSQGTAPLAQSFSGYGGDQSTQALTAGYSFSKFVHALGGVAGVFQGAGSALASRIEHGAAPAGLP
jgi:hypothetical protein